MYTREDVDNAINLIERTSDTSEACKYSRRRAAEILRSVSRDLKDYARKNTGSRVYQRLIDRANHLTAIAELA